jgi:D-tyrosyl-tRNA(Tyr) deacylase
MKVVIQRSIDASVTIDNTKVASIEKGMVILLGIGKEDNEEDIQYLIKKIIGLRIFSDENGKMNLNVQDSGGGVIIVSQFTLYADTKRGNRPSFMDSAPPDMAIPLYQSFIQHFKDNFDGTVQTGEFGADMKVALVNDGPVTIIIDSKQR